MKFTFDLTEQDYLDFNMFVIKNYKMYQRQLLVFQIIFTIIPLAERLYFFITKPENLKANVVMLFVMVILSVLFFKFFPKVFNALTLRRAKALLFKEGKNNILGERTIEFGEDKIYSKTIYTESFTDYKMITKTDFSNTAFYIFTLPAMAIIIPFRVFSSREEKDAFIVFLYSKLDEVY